MYINRQYVEPVLDFCLARSQGSSVIMAPAPAQPAHGKDGHGGPAAAMSQSLIKSFFAPLPPPPPGPGRPPKQTRPGGRPPATPAAAAESAATKRNASGNSGTTPASQESGLATKSTGSSCASSKKNKRAPPAASSWHASAPARELPPCRCPMRNERVARKCPPAFPSPPPTHMCSFIQAIVIILAGTTSVI